ncbi:hypothetical protein TNCV_2079391 [Trichonephila clavipes]|nr:hypothetical protein TNCV_2079391 [Trichonephila clavipes]
MHGHPLPSEACGFAADDSSSYAPIRDAPENPCDSLDHFRPLVLTMQDRCGDDAYLLHLKRIRANCRHSLLIVGLEANLVQSIFNIQ